MKITLFIFILILATIFFLMSLAKGNQRDEYDDGLAVFGWCFAGFCALTLDMIICFEL